MLRASPIECALVVQAVAVASFGPLAFHRMLTCPAARFTIAAGIKNGEIFLGPSLRGMASGVDVKGIANRGRPVGAGRGCSFVRTSCIPPDAHMSCRQVHNRRRNKER